jgi:hypothetical protein
MLDVIKQLLDKDLVTEETRTQIEEQWESKLSEVKEEAKTEVREEFAKRYEHDKAQMVEAMDRMMSENLQKEITEFVEDRKQLAAERVAYKTAVAPHKEMLTKFVKDSLVSEMKELHTERRSMADQLATLEAFVTKALAKEINEFNADKQAVVETRVKLVKEAKEKFAEIRSAFIKKASKIVESTVAENISKEMTQFKRDIKAARENNFGRKIFEAYASEYMTSYLNETSEVRKMQKQLDEAHKKITETETILESTKVEKSRVEDKAKRESALNELLAPLSGDKKEVMNNLLESVQTDKLKDSFNKYLPHVMKEGKRSSIITESKKSETTGDRQAKIQAEDNNEDVSNIRKLAGIN